MKNKVFFFRKTLKAILWVGISFVLIFIFIALLIQIPVIQKRVIYYACLFISSKTHTSVNIRKINILFPKSVDIEGLFLDDLKKDTLLYTGRAKVNIAFRGLFHHEVHIISFALEDANLNLDRSETDSLFNYNFLLTAFADTAKQVKTKPDNISTWTFRIDHVNVKNIRLHFKDSYGGMYIAAVIRNLNLKMDKINLTQSIFNIDELSVEGIGANVLLNKFVNTKEKKPDSILPQITARNIQIKDLSISYVDSIVNQSVLADIKVFNLKEASVDLQNQKITSDNIYLSKSKIHYTTTNSALPADTTIAVTNTITAKND